MRSETSLPHRLVDLNYSILSCRGYDGKQVLTNVIIHFPAAKHTIIGNTLTESNCNEDRHPESGHGLLQNLSMFSLQKTVVLVSASYFHLEDTSRGQSALAHTALENQPKKH